MLPKGFTSSIMTNLHCFMSQGFCCNGLGDISEERVPKRLVDLPF